MFTSTISARRPAVQEPPAELAPIVEQAAARYGVPLPVAYFVGSTESGWNPEATGPQTKSGRAEGAWQFMPETAQTFGINPHDFAQSTDAAMKYLRQLADASGGDWESAIGHYGTFSTGQGPQADAAVRQKFRDYVGNATPVAHDIAQGAGTGLIKGAGMVLGLPSDLWNMLDKGYQYALTEGAAKLGLISEDDAQQLRQPVGPEEEYQMGSEAINRHLTSLARHLGANTDQPLTVPGQYASTIASFAPSAAAFGAGAVRQIPSAVLKYGVAPGVASETAGQLTQGAAVEPYARAAGAMAPVLPAMMMSGLSRATSPMTGALTGVSDTELARAQRLLDLSRSVGAPLTVPEAVQAATGSATRLGDVQRVVEQSPAGSAIMRPFYAQRPAQMDALGRSTFQGVGAPVEPYELAPRVQNAADAVVSDENAARTAAVNPHYAAAATDTVDPQAMEAFLAKIDAMIARDRTGLMSPELTRLRDALTETPATATTARVPVTDIENLDNARKFFRDRLDQPGWAQEAIPKAVGARVNSLLGDLRTIMESASPSFARGRQLYEHISEQRFNPLVRSPTGQLASAETFEKQAKILFNTQPLSGSERAIGRAVRDIVRSDPEAAQGIVRQYLERTFDEATQSNAGGPNQWGGAKFAAVIAGNSQQARNLEAAVRALPNGDVRWNALQRSLDIMRATGTRFPAGSMTEFNRMMNQYLEVGNPVGLIMSEAASPGRFLTIAKDIYRRIAYHQNTGRLAAVFAQGDVDDLRRIVQSGTRSLRGQAALVGALARQGVATTPGGEEAQP